MVQVYLRAAAQRDLVEHFAYIAENASLDLAERFLTSAEASFNDLAGQPMIGAPLTVGSVSRKVGSRARVGFESQSAACSSR